MPEQQARRAEVAIVYEGTDISKDIAPYLIHSHILTMQATRPMIFLLVLKIEKACGFQIGSRQKATKLL